MARSGTIQKAISTGYKLQLVWSITQSIANNTSSVTAKVQLVSTGATYTINSSASKSGSLTINGTKYTFSFSAALSGNQTKTIFSKTVTVKHNADGTKTCAFACSAGIKVTLNNTFFDTVSASGSGVFDRIPRATTPTLSASSVNMGAAITINMPRAASAFTHTLTYKFGNASGTIGSGLGTSKAWTVPLSLASQVPSSTSGTCTITCKTYNGSSLIGTKAVSFTAKVPTSVVPTISSVTVADTNTNYATQFVSLVQGKSKAKFTIKATGVYGSTIKTYKTTIEGKNYSGATPTTTILTSSGNVTARITVTDSRGRSATVDKTFYLIPYAAPKIATLEGFRSDAAGAENYEGTNAKITIAYTIASANNKNTSSYKLEYKLQSDTVWTALENGTGYRLNKDLITGAIFNIDNAYDIKLTIADYFGSISKTFQLPTAFTLVDFNASGRAVAFGKVSEKVEGVEFALKTYFSHGETPDSATALQTGQDLNTVLDAGYYFIPNTAVSGSLLNKPYSGTATGSLLVINEGDTGQKVQIIHKGSKTDGCIYERCYYQGAWGDWHTVYNGGSKILWTGGYYMTEGHKITLSEPVSSQPNGIVLVFSEYVDKAVKNSTFVSHFVHKSTVATHNGVGHNFSMCTSNLAMFATKYLYIADTTITGHTNNDLVATGACGIKQTNNRFVLRYVIGV